MQPLVENANIPAFLGKLWKMVNDPSTDNLICWSQAGNSFIIQNQAQFWYELLPLYYKHNNMSSFVRQLNMYGFHKISTVENGSMDADRDEIQFYHPYFQKGQMDKLKNIKRKGTSTKGHESNQGPVRHDDLTKVLTDVKQLRGRQSSVDSQLSSMKQENAVLWRELALLRQKHLKQQQIVNKLIQFLVTLVQPATSQRMGVGAKRRMPLMLHEIPSKRAKSRKNSSSRQSTTDGGPTIHELENEIELSPEELLEVDIIDEVPLINSPATPTTVDSSRAVNSPVSNQNIDQNNANQESPNAGLFWVKPEFVNIDEENEALSENENLINTLHNNTDINEQIFLNPNSRDTLIGNLVNSGSYNDSASGKKNITNKKTQPSVKQIDSTVTQKPNMQVATKNNDLSINNGTSSTNECFRDDLDVHVDSTQSELDQLKDILNGCSTFDANTLLGLFAESDPEDELRGNPQNKETANSETGDPLVSGTELTPGNDLIDFNGLFDDSLNSQDGNLVEAEYKPIVQNSGLDTPLILKNEPTFSRT